MKKLAFEDTESLVMKAEAINSQTSVINETKKTFQSLNIERTFFLIYNSKNAWTKAKKKLRNG